MVEKKASDRADRRTRILDAAEEMFAADGFEGTALRTISKHADVDLALIAHYFGSKQSLFETVLARRADEIHRERVELLEDCRSRTRAEPTLEGLVDAFLRPIFRRAHADPEWHNYLRLLARLSVNREGVNRIGKLYDPTAKYFINAMRANAPEASDEQLYWAYYLLLGGLVFVGSDNRRLDRLSEGRFSSGDYKTAYKYLIQFVAGGISSVLSSAIAVSDLVSHSSKSERGKGKR